MQQPTFNDMIQQFKQNNYVEIGYITGIRRFYLS